jgi:hypothetical protein
VTTQPNLRVINSPARATIAAMFVAAKAALRKRVHPRPFALAIRLEMIEAMVKAFRPYEFGIGQAVIVTERKLDSHLRLAFVDGKYVPAVEWVSVEKPAIVTSRFRHNGRNYYRVYGHRILVFEAFVEDRMRADWTPVSLTALRGYQNIALVA